MPMPHASSFLLFLLVASFLPNVQAGFRVPRYRETAQEYQESTEKFVQAVQKHNEAREASNKVLNQKRNGPLARSSDDKACSHEVMADITNLYLQAQPVSPNGWAAFFATFDPNMIISSNLLDAPGAVGKEACEELLLGVNTQYQNISEIIGEPFNTFGHNTITTYLRKAQGSLRVGVQYNISIYQQMTFSDAPDCLVTSLFEFADAGKTAETLSLELSADPSALTCERIKWICANNIPNFGTPNNNCMLLWMNAPAMIKNDTAPLDDLQLISPSRSLSCANTILSTIQNEGAALPEDEVAFLCSLLGAPIPDVPGCWS